ncbi:MAG: two-component system, OmpR family, response regulator QseB [Micromonosporaceae bacterium]|nr:two-component system, OmpR family, response regulator QseB [Micromonosporaceae bacterium]
MIFFGSTCHDRRVSDVTLCPPQPPKLLLVEDDPNLAAMLVEVLHDAGFAVDHAPDGQAGLHLGLARGYQVMVLDRRLPAIEGVDLLRRLRGRGVTAGVLMLTARATVGDRVEGLNGGADDYLVKPFEVDELIARLRALMRRQADTGNQIPIGAARLDLDARRVFRPDHPQLSIPLSGREFELLRVLASRPSQVFSRDELLVRVFDEGDSESDRAVDIYVHYLRRKLGRGAIRTVRGFGYQLGTM